jgi:hypothetical protein
VRCSRLPSCVLPGPEAPPSLRRPFTPSPDNPPSNTTCRIVASLGEQRLKIASSEITGYLDKRPRPQLLRRRAADEETASGSIVPILRSRDDSSAALACMGQGIAHEVNTAALPARIQHFGNGGFNALVRIDDHREAARALWRCGDRVRAASLYPSYTEGNETCPRRSICQIRSRAKGLPRATASPGCGYRPAQGINDGMYLCRQSSPTATHATISTPFLPLRHAGEREP